MNEDMLQFYQAPNISKYEDLHLLTLREQCAALESQIHDILFRLSEQDRQLLECYLDLRDTLEIETVKVALRWGKAHYL